MKFSAARYFLILCEELNFGAAARRCRIAQPTLTQAIKRLERQLNGALFERHPIVAPTPLALALKPHFEMLVTAADRLQAEASRYQPCRRGRDREQAPLTL